MHAQSCCINQSWVQLIHTRASNQSHVHLHLVLQQLHSAVNTGQSIRTHSVQERSTNSDSLSTKTKSLDDIRSSPYTTINENLNAVLPSSLTENRHNFSKDFNTRACEIQLSTSVVGED